MLDRYRVLAEVCGRLGDAACGAQAREKALAISPETVKDYLNGVYRKLGVRDRTQAAVLALIGRYLRAGRIMEPQRLECQAAGGPGRQLRRAERS